MTDFKSEFEKIKKVKLRTFNNFPTEKCCPVCGTNNDFECFLVPIAGTEDDGICEAMVVHTACIKLVYFKNQNIFVQTL